MKRAVAELLRGRTTWQLVAIAAVLTVVGLLVTYNVYASTRRQIAGLLTLLWGVGGAALVLAAYKRGQEVERGGPALRLWGSFVGVVLALAGLVAYVTYAFGHFKTDMIAGCNGSLLPETTAERRAALVEAEARLQSPFAWPVRLLDDEAARECARSRADFERLERGLCTRWVLHDVTCTCGEESYPYARCAEPNCWYAPGKPDLFTCVGDDIPDGYIGH